MAKLHRAPDKTPTTTEAHGYINPEDGVAATRPAIVPEQKPTMVHRRSILKSNRHQTMPPNAAAIIEFQIAKIARRLAPKALPPLKPSQPNQSMNALSMCQRREKVCKVKINILPKLTKDTLCGRKLSNSDSSLRPSTHAYANPLTPLPISTGPPPTHSAIKIHQCARGQDLGLTCEVQDTPFKCPTIHTPSPIRYWTIN